MPEPGGHPLRPPRQFSLDALRGFAVMGILAMNIVAFALPDMAYFSPIAGGGMSLADRLSWAAGFVFIDGKMRGIFTLLFGASMMLIADAAVARGDDPAGVHVRRMGWLLVFGLAHYLLVWNGDILTTYALVGMVAFAMRDWSPAALWRAALGIFALGTLFWGAVYGGLLAVSIIGEQPDAGDLMASWARDMRLDGAFAAEVDHATVATMRGDYASIVMARLTEIEVTLVSTVMFFHETLSLMLIGMALYRQGWLADDADLAAWRRRTMRLLPAGLMLSAVVAWIIAELDYDIFAALNGAMYWAAVPRLMLTIAYVGLGMLAVARWRHHPLMARVAAAGRMAFSNYLMTSIVMTTIFYGYGLGLYGHVARSALWLFVLGGAAAMLVWSQPWLRRFHYGPFEWLWRRLARGGTVPFAR